MPTHPLNCGIKLNPKLPFMKRDAISKFIHKQFLKDSSSNCFYTQEQSYSLTGIHQTFTSFICMFCKDQTKTKFIVEEVLRNTQSWNIKSVVFRNFGLYDSILKGLSHIGFDQLIILSLEECGLENIEPISWMDMPMVQNLSFEKNNITNYKSFGKCVFTEVDKILIGDSSFVTFDQIKFFATLFYKRSEQRKESVSSKWGKGESLCLQMAIKECKRRKTRDTLNTKIYLHPINYIELSNNLDRNQYSVYTRGHYFKDGDFRCILRVNRGNKTIQMTRKY